MTHQPKTLFDPVEFGTPKQVATQNALLAADPVVATMLDSFPEPAAVLNRQRQIVLANDKLAAQVNRSRESLIGMRTGEAFACINAKGASDLCGTGSSCRFCGNANAIVNSQAQLEPDVREFRLLCSSENGVEALDLQVWTNPLTVGGEQFTVFAVRDTSDEKRRSVLEQLFFHDILNAATALKGIIKIWPRLNAQQSEKMHRMAGDLTDQIVEEIQAHRDLTSAERGDFAVEPEEIDAAELLAGICALHAQEAIAAGKHVAGPQLEGPTSLLSVPLLLRRVLGNLIKNAVEASSSGDTVTVSFRNHGVPTFLIHNPGVMSEAVQAQLFQRSFTTNEGRGRGVGAYSVKLFVDRYLNGNVTFHSTAQAGTTFVVTLPVASKDDAAESA